jgi:hypothetical protein
LFLTPSQLTHGGTIVLWIILVNGVHIQTIRLVCASQKQQLMAIPVKITRYEISYDVSLDTFEMQCYSCISIDKNLPFSKVYSLNLWQVTTEDGYILSLKRIPYGLSDGGNSTNNTRQPVLLFHGLMVVRTLLDKPCATESHAYLNQMFVLDRTAFHGYWARRNNHLDLF